MAYNITTTAGSALATVTDGTVNTTATSLTLIGKNYAGYGIFLNENYVKLLENFSATAEPTAPLTGQLWYDSANRLLKVYASGTWKPISSSIAASSTPAGVPVIGDLWWDTTNLQLKIYGGSSWILIGPASPVSAGTSGSLVSTINDSLGGSHVIVRTVVQGTTVAITTKDSAFTIATADAITGFSVLSPGITLSSSITNAALTGTATNASALGGFASNLYVRNNTSSTITGALTLNDNTGLTVGTSNNFNIGVSGGAVVAKNDVNGSDFNFYVKAGNVSTKSIGISGTNASVTIPTVFNASANVNVTGNINALAKTIVSDAILPISNNSLDIGSSGLKFASMYATTFYGQSTTSQYADLAERFAADEEYSAGTVVELGGSKEVTAVAQDLSDKVFGVISKQAGFLMNGSAGSDVTHPPVAINGRVPVKVTGIVRKGDRLVSAGKGMARAARVGEVTPWNVIGRSLQDKTTEGEGTVEAVVKLNS